MCGIFGSIGFDYRHTNFIQLLEKSMIHRGPDSFNTYFDNSGKIFMAHARLAVLDLSANANQPMCDSITGNQIVFNGEIYNFKEIKTELESLGEVFHTNSDTEVILKGYKVWNINILSRIDGMFAFAIWDNQKKQLILARDRMGEKPLYYAKAKDNKFVFSSELTSILINPKFDPKINLKSLNDYLTYGYIRGNNSIIEGINKLPPAHYLVFKDEKVIEFKEYWELSKYFLKKTRYSSFQEAQEICFAKLESAIKKQSLSDVPIGAFLSGGVDSSLVTSILASQIETPLTFCAGFAEKEFDESSEAQKVAEKIHSKHYSFVLNNLTFDEITLPFEYFDEPFSDGSSIPMFYLTKFTKNKVTVSLSGDGGDELFLGYPTYLADKLYNSTKYIPRNAFKIASEFMGKHLKSNHGKVSWEYKLKAFLGGAQGSFESAHDDWRIIFEHPPIEPYEKQHHDYWGHLPDSHYLDRASYVDMKTWLPNDILFKVDRMSMAHSLEARSPLLDRDLVEFAVSLPIEYKLNYSNSKIILKKILKSKFGINSKKKLGFNSPTSKWIKKHSRQFEESLISSNLWSQNFINDLISDHISYKKDNSHKVMTLIGFTKWHERIMSMSKMRQI